MTYRQRLSRLEAKSDLRHPKEHMQIHLNFIGPDGPEDADFATTLDDEPLCFHRRPEETVEMFEERVCGELRVRDEHNARKYPVQVIVFQCNSERDGPQSGSPPGHPDQRRLTEGATEPS
jgi:hypothetical protein